VGSDTQRWGLVCALTITLGDLVFENGYCVTEDQKSGLAFLNEEGERIAGRITEDPTL
jgi:hypothetical protein